MSAESFQQEFKSDLPEEAFLEAADQLRMATQIFFDTCAGYKEDPDPDVKEMVLADCEDYIRATVDYFRTIQQDNETDSYDFAIECQEVLVALDQARVDALNKILERDILKRVLYDPASVTREDWNVDGKSEEDSKEWSCAQSANMAAEMAVNDTERFIAAIANMKK